MTAFALSVREERYFFVFCKGKTNGNSSYSNKAMNDALLSIVRNLKNNMECVVLEKLYKLC